MMGIRDVFKFYWKLKWRDLAIKKFILKEDGKVLYRKVNFKAKMERQGKKVWVRIDTDLAKRKDKEFKLMMLKVKRGFDRLLNKYFRVEFKLTDYKLWFKADYASFEECTIYAVYYRDEIMTFFLPFSETGEVVNKKTGKIELVKEKKWWKKK